ncbi:MAG: glycosyltransferase family 2 protein [Paramuribaculum sp.]|nr:glycosyltransferase family 2 protein [Paramuribaculum sp.]
MAQLSATILTLNEARHIRQCIESLRDLADEIIVVDSLSTDGTPDICRELGCSVTRRRMAGYGAQRQYATSLTTHDYVLALDADEVISPALRSTLIELKKNGFRHRGYSFPRLNFYCGTPVKHCGWYPDIQVRLFDKRYANWNLHDVAERVIFRDNVRPHLLDGDILHYRCDTPAEYRLTEENHARYLAGRIAAENPSIGSLRPLWEGIKSFVDCYIAQGGIFDGIAGRDISVERFRSSRDAYRLAREIMTERKEKDQ